MPLALDTSTVTDVKTTFNNVATTASFTAPASSRIYACVTTNASSAVDSAAASVTGGALTWSLVDISSASNNAGRGGTSAEVWQAWNATSQSMTVSATPNAGATGSGWEIRLKVSIATGDEGATFTGAHNHASSASGAPSAAVSAAANSLLIGAIADWAHSTSTPGAARVAGTNTTIVLDQIDAEYSAQVVQSTSPVSAGSNSLSLTAPTDANYNMAVVEIKAAAGGSPITATGAIALVGTATVRAPVTGSGSIALTGAGNLQAPVGGTGAISLTGTATAQAPITATGAMVLVGSASLGLSAIGVIALVGTAVAQAPITATGALSLVGTGTLRAPLTATGGLALVGVAIGSARVAATGSMALVGIGTVRAAAGGVGIIALIGTGNAGGRLAGVGALVLVGIGTAQQPLAGIGVIALVGTAAISGGPVLGFGMYSRGRTADNVSDLFSWHRPIL